MGALARRLGNRVRRSELPEGRRSTEHNHPRLQRRIRRLESRVEGLEQALSARVVEVEQGLREQRELNQRVAVLGDLVAGVIGAAARGDKAEFEAALAEYADGI